jgi:hypothetical protein
MMLCAHLFIFAFSFGQIRIRRVLQADLLNSLESFYFGDELGYILDWYVAPLINEVKSFVLDETKEGEPDQV